MNENEETYIRVCKFLNQEAYLLDTYKFQEWLEILSKDISYIMARRIVNENKGNDYDIDSPLMLENYSSLKARIERLKSVYAWGEVPRSRYAHVIGWINVLGQNNGGVIAVQSSVLFIRNREDSYENEMLSYQRQDLFNDINGKLLLLKRLIIPDQPVIGLSTLSNIY